MVGKLKHPDWNKSNTKHIGLRQFFIVVQSLIRTLFCIKKS